MSADNEQANDSRRKFIKVAVVSAYITPLIASMPAHATFKSHGSQPVKKARRRAVWKKRIHRKYRRHNRFYSRRW